MRRVIYCITLVILGFVFPAIAAQRADLDAFLAGLRQHSAEVVSLAGPFTQEKRLAMFDRPVVFTGKLAMARPNRLRWEFIDPVLSVLIFDGETGMRCSDRGDPVVFDMTKDPVMRAVGGQLQLWISGDFAAMEDRYALRLEKPATLVVTPVSEKEKEYIASVVITFAQPSMQPAEVTINEAGGDTTRIVFGEPMVNGALADELFRSCWIDD
ncbi:LolA family protein [Desulforhopalus singaporensis]|nr:outer membrane lipoprotein carrier protein LolA [Desulforhopalus singaporensis]